MEILDAGTLGKRVVKLGLLDPDQLRHAQEEVGVRNPDPQPLLRVLERKGHLTPFQTSKLLKGDTDGFFLGGFRLLYRISSGSFGRVYRADDPHTGRIVAVKVLRKRMSEKPKMVDMFYREAKLGMSLRHPNIVEILNVNKDPASKQHFIVMEFVEGGNLREILKIRKSIPIPEALHILEDTTKGLAYAFSKGVTHRDMKLTNILISAQGAAKLVDFGLAQMLGSLGGRGGGGSDDKDKDEVDRTVDYAGLERATGVVPGDTRSDIFFLGCVFSEMITGRSPLVWTKSAQQRMDRQRFANLDSLKRDELQAPPSLFTLVESMVALTPENRFQTTSQLLDAIRRTRQDVERGVSTPGETVREGHTVSRSIFIVERNEKAQEKLREKFKELNYRVMMASDPLRALDRFRQQPFDALVINAGHLGEEAVNVFRCIFEEAVTRAPHCVGILILTDEQRALTARLEDRPTTAVLFPPVTIKGLCQKIDELMTG